MSAHADEESYIMVCTANSYVPSYVPFSTKTSQLDHMPLTEASSLNFFL